MVRNQKKADAAAQNYKHCQQRIAKLKAKKEELEERNKVEKNIQIFSECMGLASQIRGELEYLDQTAHVIVRCLYGDEEEQNECK